MGRRIQCPCIKPKIRRKESFSDYDNCYNQLVSAVLQPRTGVVDYRAKFAGEPLHYLTIDDRLLTIPEVLEPPDKHGIKERIRAEKPLATQRVWRIVVVLCVVLTTLIWGFLNGMHEDSISVPDARSPFYSLSQNQRQEIDTSISLGVRSPAADASDGRSESNQFPSPWPANNPSQSHAHPMHPKKPKCRAHGTV
jgi:hypothetical protein